MQVTLRSGLNSLRGEQGVPGQPPVVSSQQRSIRNPEIRRPAFQRLRFSAPGDASEVLVDRLCEGSFHGPFMSHDTAVQVRIRDSCLLGPFVQRQGFSVKSSFSGSPSVPHLLYCGCPAAVSRSVWPIIVDSVEGHPFRPRTHVFQEIHEPSLSVPSVTDSDSPSSIVRVSGGFTISTTRTDLHPDLVFRDLSSRGTILPSSRSLAMVTSSDLRENLFFGFVEHLATVDTFAFPDQPAESSSAHHFTDVEHINLHCTPATGRGQYTK